MGADSEPAWHLGRAPPPGTRCTRTEVGLIVETGEPRDVHHFAASSAMEPARSIPISSLRSLVDMERDGYLPEGVGRPDRRGQVHQGDQQGPAQDLLQDGHLDRAVLLRRANLRGDRTES